MNPYREKLLTVGYSRRRDRPRAREGREHPESGEPFKAVRDEHGNVTTEHGKPGSGVSDRQDVHIYVTQPATGEVEV